MSDTAKALVGSWNVSFKQYRWTYVFSEGGRVTWRDIWNGRTGSGIWTLQGTGVSIAWQNSQTREVWELPINPGNQSGTIDADYASGRFTAIKDQTRFDAVPPEGQLDAFACWAACLAWYTRASPDVETMAQQAIITRSDPKTWASNGTITLNGLMTISLPNVFLERHRVNVGQFEARVQARPFPMLVAFSTGPLGGHVNVIHNYDEKSKLVSVMEPWFPDPSSNPNYRLDGLQYFNPTTSTLFKFTGRHISRPLGYYTSKPLEGQFLIG
jgi:hypothetical protein